MHKSSRQQGFSLLEILVTIFIMSVGLFGLSAMQLSSLKQVSNSQTKTLVNYYLEDMAERMRSNKAGIKHGDYDLLTVKTNPSPNIAINDSYEWNDMMTQTVSEGGLPSGAEGTVTKRSEGSGLEAVFVYDIKITWTEKQREETNGMSASKEAILSLPF